MLVQNSFQDSVKQQSIFHQKIFNGTSQKIQTIQTSYTNYFHGMAELKCIKIFIFEKVFYIKLNCLTRCEIVYTSPPMQWKSLTRQFSF